MAGADVASCAAAVVSAFHGAADLVHAQREKRDKQKKRRKEKDIEDAVEEKLLHRVLVDAARQVHLVSVDRGQRFGSAFDTGDDIATSELKNIMISLQTEIISVLQVAQSEEGPLDRAPVHEAAITHKNSTIRAMDDLCKRILLQASTRPCFQEETATTSMCNPGSISRGHSSAHCRGSSDATQNYSLGPSNVSVVNGSTVHARSFSRTQGFRQTQDSGLQRVTSGASTPAYFYRRSYERGRNSSPSAACLPEDDNTCDSYLTPSLHDSAIGSETGIRHRATASITSTLLSDETMCSEDSAESGAKRDELRIVQIPNSKAVVRPEGTLAEHRAGSALPSRTDSAPMSKPCDNEDDIEAAIRASTAPEVVTKEFQSLMLSPTFQKSPVSPEYPIDMRNIHPALRQDFYTESILTSETDPLWSPLDRPAESNNHHNFCKGAWSARQSLQEGLAIAMIHNHRNEIVAHWKCKHCDFRSRGLDNSTVLPDQVYFSSNGVRYRWLFLAKSHTPAIKTHQKPELYSYGCIFCTAQGRTTQVYDGLDKMMEHVVIKHKTDMLTPEVLQKTRCVVGGAIAREEDWDVNLPTSVSVSRRMTRDLKEFLVGAVTGIL